MLIEIDKKQMVPKCKQANFHILDNITTKNQIKKGIRIDKCRLCGLQIINRKL